MDIDEAVDWGVEDESAPAKIVFETESTVNSARRSDGKANSPPRTEMDDDAISLGGEDDDTEALMGYRGDVDVDTLKPTHNTATSSNRQPISNGTSKGQNETRLVDSAQSSPSRTKTGSAAIANSRLPKPPANVGLPARPNFETTQRVRSISQSTWFKGIDIL